jgi:hypothetical protein
MGGERGNCGMHGRKREAAKGGSGLCSGDIRKLIYIAPSLCRSMPALMLEPV